MGTINGRQKLQEITTDQAVFPIQVSPWKRPWLADVSDLFTH